MNEALEGVDDDWRAAIARRLAGSLDLEANASMARELRAVMERITGDEPDIEGTPLDEFERRLKAER